MAHDVFVSYSNHDKLTADAVCSTLENHGIRCWIAPRDILPGVDWTDAIIDAISGCKVFLLILSGASNSSEQVKREVQNAVGEAKPILPLRIEEVDLSKHMKYFIGTPHWMDALTPPMEMHLLRMSQTVRALLGSMDEKGIDPPPTMRAIPAPEAILETPVAAAPAPPAAAVISDAAEARAAQILAEYVGPLAKVLAKRAAKQATSRDDFHKRLAEQITSPSEQAAFLKKCGG